MFQSQVDQRIADGIYALDERILRVEDAVAKDRGRMKELEKVSHKANLKNIFVCCFPNQNFQAGSVGRKVFLFPV